MDGSIFVVDVVFNFSGQRAKTNAPTFGVVLVVPTGWFPTPRFALKIRSLGSDFFQARPSHSKHSNVTAAFLKVSLTSGTEVFSFTC